MYLSVIVTPHIHHNEAGDTLASVHVRVTGQEGRSQVIAWEQFFGREHTVVLSPPSGTAGALSVKTIKKRSTLQERKRIEAIGGRRHSGSGALSGNKSDGSTERWRMENKFTTASSYRVTLDDLTKLRSECRNAQAPVFNVDFQDKRTGATKESWVLVPSKVWERMANAVTDDR